MDFTEILSSLNRASLFELCRMHSAIGRELESLERLASIKRRLRPGQPVRYFLANENRSVEGRLIEVRRTTALVSNAEDGSRWKIPLYFINLDGVDTAIGANRKRGGIDRQRLGVGDRVGFVGGDAVERYGVVVRLNPKTAGLDCGHGEGWRVPYGMLFPVIDGDTSADGQGLSIEGVVINRE